MTNVFVFAILCSVYLHINGATVNAKVPTTCKKVVDIAMVIDESGSITDSNFQKIKDFLQKTVARFSVSQYGAHFGLVKYSTNAELVFPLNQYTDVTTLQNAIKNLSYNGGSTNTGKALKLTRSKLFGGPGNRVNVPDILILFTDGDSQDHAIAVEVANDLKKNGVNILVVAIGTGLTVDKLIRQLRELVSEERYVFKTVIDALDTIRDDLVGEMCEAAGCIAAKFNKKGCFETPKSSGTALFNNRNNIDWGDKWDQFIDDLVCQCGAAAKQKSFKYFFIQFYGECWGSNTIPVTGPQAGPGKCWGKRPDHENCDRTAKLPICVGVAGYGYVYQLQ